MVVTEVDVDEDDFKSSPDKVFSKEETVDLKNLELDWIDGLRDQVEFLNGEMKHYCISFRVQKREFVIGGVH